MRSPSVALHASATSTAVSRAEHRQRGTGARRGVRLFTVRISVSTFSRAAAAG